MNPAIDFPWKKKNVTADTLVHTGACVLHSITFNGMTTVGDVAIYDGVSAAGTLIATLILRSAVQVSCQPFTLILDCEMLTGIYFDYDATFAGNFTVTYF
jgi:hypothetical protein